MSDGRRSAARVAVVIVTYRSADVIEGCLAALPAALAGVDAVAVVVADNASSDDTLARARRVRPDVLVHPMGGNRGYAAAINAGAAAAPEHDYLLVLNPDTRPAPGCVLALVEALRDDSGRGLAVPRFEAPDGSRANSLREEPSLHTALAEAVLGGRRAARRGIGEVVADAARYDRAGPTDWATGAAVLVSRPCADRVGAWDESFLLYSEETDYMLRARDAGFVTWYVPGAVVVHRGGELSTSPFLWSLMMANKVRLYTRRHDRLRGALFRIVTLFGELARGVAGSARSRAAVRLLVRPAAVPERLPS